MLSLLHILGFKTKIKGKVQHFTWKIEDGSYSMNTFGTTIILSFYYRFEQSLTGSFGVLHFFLTMFMKFSHCA